MEGNRGVVFRSGRELLDYGYTLWYIMLLGLSHDIWFLPAWSAASTGVSALRTLKQMTFESACRIPYKTGVPSVLTEALRLVPARVRFQIVPSIIDDSIDGHDLYLACVIEGHHSGLGVVFEHYCGVYVLLASFVKWDGYKSWGGVEEVSKAICLRRCREDTDNVPAVGTRTVSVYWKVSIYRGLAPYTGDIHK